MAEIIPVFLGIGEIIKTFYSFADENTNNNNFECELENTRMAFAKQMEQDRLETDQKIKDLQDESSRKLKEIQENSEKNISAINKEINEFKATYEKDNKDLKKAIKDQEDDYNEKIGKIKKQRKKDKESLDRIEKEIVDIKDKFIINKNENDRLKLDNEKLLNENKVYEKQNKDYQTQLDGLLLKQKKESQCSLDQQKNEISKINRNNQILFEEIEETKNKNKLELESLSKKYNDDIEERKKQLKELEKEKKIEEDKKKEEENKQELKDKKNTNLSRKKFLEKSQMIIKQFIEKLKNQILQKNFFDEVLNEYNIDEISKIIEQILSKINLKQVFDIKTKNFLNLVETLNVNPEMNHLNILLLGPTGSGKSTLINVLLELEGQERAEVGDDNNPKTMDFHAYTSNKKKYIRCYDSRGIEKNKEYSLDKFITNSKNLILKNLKGNNPDEFIHIILYCFEGCKFVEEVRDSLYKLMDLYNDETLPIILVHTRGVQGEDDEFLQMIKDTLQKEKRKIDLINICAEKDDDFPAFGIDELYNLMISKVKESVKSACFSSVQNKVKDNFIKVNTDYKNKFKEEFEKIIVEEMKDIRLNSDINDQKKKYLKIFSNNIFEKILFDNKKHLSETCKKILENYLNYFFKWILEKSEQYMIDFISKNSFELISELLSIQHSINAKYDNKLQIQKNTEEWKEELDKKLKEELDNAILFNLLKEGSIFIYDEFNKMLLDILEKNYKIYLKEENEFITNVTKGKVEEIINNFVFN